MKEYVSNTHIQNYWYTEINDKVKFNGTYVDKTTRKPLQVKKLTQNDTISSTEIHLNNQLNQGFSRGFSRKKNDAFKCIWHRQRWQWGDKMTTDLGIHHLLKYPSLLKTVQFVQRYEVDITRANMYHLHIAKNRSFGTLGSIIIAISFSHPRWSMCFYCPENILKIISLLGLKNEEEVHQKRKLLQLFGLHFTNVVFTMLWQCIVFVRI